MRNSLLKLSGILLFNMAIVSAQTSRHAPSQAAAQQAAPASSIALISGEETHPAPKFDIANIDKTVDPCVDFYQFACGNWMKNNPIPADQPEWISFSEVYEHNLLVLRQVLEKASVNDPKRSPITQKDRRLLRFLHG
jgi:putative endopeptidase